MREGLKDSASEELKEVQHEFSQDEGADKQGQDDKTASAKTEADLVSSSEETGLYPIGNEGLYKGAKDFHSPSPAKKNPNKIQIILI